MTVSALCSYFNGLICFRTCALQVACVAGGILVPVEPFLATEPPCEVSGGKSPPQINLYTHSSHGFSAKTVQRSHAYPASYAGYTPRAFLKKLCHETRIRFGFKHWELHQTDGNKKNYSKNMKRR